MRYTGMTCLWSNSAYTILSLSPEIRGMFCGDANGSGSVEDADKIAFWNIQTGSNGYLEADQNLDGRVDNRDKNEYWLSNLGQGSQIP